MKRWLGVAVVLAMVLVPIGSAVPTQAAGRSFVWSGQRWWVLDTGSGRCCAGPNRYSASTSNVWVDSSGRLHLRITKRNGRWYAAEIVGLDTLGYGVYRWTLGSAVHALDPNVVLGLFTYGDDPASANREIDIEFSRWGDARATLNGQFVVQPHNQAGNRYRFIVPPVTRAAYAYTWAPGALSFLSEWDVTRAGGRAPESWVYQRVAPTSLNETPRANLWLFEGRAPTDGREVEVVIEKFEFTPLSTTSG